MRRDRALTLIELLVIIAVVAILAAIYAPVFAEARERFHRLQEGFHAKQQEDSETAIQALEFRGSDVRAGVGVSSVDGRDLAR